MLHACGEIKTVKDECCMHVGKLFSPMTRLNAHILPILSYTVLYRGSFWGGGGGSGGNGRHEYHEKVGVQFYV